MKIEDTGLAYSLANLMLETLIIGCLYLCNVSPISSDHIMGFLKVFIPVMLFGGFVILRFNMHDDSAKKRKDRLSEGLLFCFGLASFLIGSFGYHVIAILLGAPLLANFEETFAFACLCSVLTVFPLYTVHETRWEDFVNYLPESLYVRESLPDCVKMVSCFTVIGAWAGAFPIPLDWDRDWQNWPITCCVGAIVGHVLGLCFVTLSCIGFIPSSPPDWKNKIT